MRTFLIGLLAFGVIMGLASMQMDIRRINDTLERIATALEHPNEPKT